MIQTDIDIQLSQDKDYILSALFEADSFVYALFDSDFKLYKVKNRSMPIQKFQEVKDAHDFSKIKIGVKDTFFQHDGDASSEKRIPWHYIKEKMTGKNIYTSYDIKYLERIEGDKRHLSTLMQNFYYLREGSFLHIHNDQERSHYYLQIDGEMLFFNTFFTKTKEDVLYYAMLILDGMNLDSSSIQVKLSGLINTGSQIHMLLFPYLQNLDFVDLDLLDIPEDLNLRSSYYFDHYINASCG